MTAKSFLLLCKHLDIYKSVISRTAQIEVTTSDRLNQQVADSSAVSRLQYSINAKDQVTAYASGGALHVSGDLDRPGQILSTDSTKTPTALDGSFSAWVDAPASGAAIVWAEDYSGHSVSTAVKNNDA